MKNQPRARQETCQLAFDEVNGAVEGLALLPLPATTGRPVLQGSGLSNPVVLNIQHVLLLRCA